ncbi:hypothetical protein [Anaerorhabdus sp.]|uniref:hypothetical protein n=1 Tax=Anaerorhabdus sp. TaxID=1872524 RepID=UPI002FC6802C
MCIYLKNATRELTYKKREHVIPASLGEKTMLPIGTVSDQANELFSKTERTAVRETLLSVNRNNVGPGKRGSKSVEKVETPTMRVLEVVVKNDDKPFMPVKLGFLHFGVVHVIPQIFLEMRVDGSIKYPIYNEGFSKTDIDEYFRSLYKFIDSSEMKYVLVETELKRTERFINIGHFKNKWFIYTNINGLNIINLLKAIKKRVPEKVVIQPCIAEEYHYSYILEKMLDDSFTFIYLKTAFNFTSLILGEEFMMDEQFDDLRSALVNVKGLDLYTCNEPFPNWLKEWAKNNLDHYEHFVAISIEGDYIKAYVSYYSGTPMVINIGRNDYGYSLKKIIKCDWENRKEEIISITSTNDEIRTMKV